jgi:hypothetical protein
MRDVRVVEPGLGRVASLSSRFCSRWQFRFQRQAQRQRQRMRDLPMPCYDWWIRRPQSS